MVHPGAIAYSGIDQRTYAIISNRLHRQRCQDAFATDFAVIAMDVFCGLVKGAGASMGAMHGSKTDMNSELTVSRSNPCLKPSKGHFGRYGSAGTWLLGLEDLRVESCHRADSS